MDSTESEQITGQVHWSWHLLLDIAGFEIFKVLQCIVTLIYSTYMYSVVCTLLTSRILSRIFAVTLFLWK